MTELKIQLWTKGRLFISGWRGKTFYKQQQGFIEASFYVVIYLSPIIHHFLRILKVFSHVITTPSYLSTWGFFPLVETLDFLEAGLDSLSQS